MVRLNTIFYYLVLLLIILFPFSRAATSISVILISIVSLFYVFTNTEVFQTIKNNLVVILVLFLSLCFSLFYTNNTGLGLNIILLKIPLLLCVIWIPIYKTLKKEEIINLALAYCFSISIVSIASITNYFMHFNELNELVLQSKAIPIKLSYIYHIEFSVASALSALISLYFVFLTKGINKYMFSILTLVAVLSLHILSARTGLLFLYAACGVLGLYSIVKYNFKHKTLIVIMAVCLPLIALFTVPTLNNRLSNTIQDLQVIIKGKNPNNFSIGQRVEAWKTGSYIIKNNLMLGVGVGDVKEEMDKAYKQLNSPLLIENRKKPHNQLIETGVQVGMLGVVLLLIYMFFPIHHFRLKNVVFIAFILSFLLAMMFESLLERQSGVIIFVVGYVLFQHPYFYRGLLYKSLNTV